VNGGRSLGGSRETVNEQFHVEHLSCQAARRRTRSTRSKSSFEPNVIKI